ncbi:MAG: hypothetical protein AAF203_04085 [Pseudomonadota bacterium]
MKLTVLILIFGLGMSGCMFLPATKDQAPNIEFPKKLKKANDLIVSDKTSDAKVIIEDYLNESINIHWFGHAYFLKGFLFEKEDQPENAIREYRNAIQHTNSYDSLVEAKALYNLSFVFEQTRKMDELLVSLIDLMKRRSFFNQLTGQVEIPARLAATYAYFHREKEAAIFHQQATNGYNKLIRNSSKGQNRDDISKALYYMGFAVFDPPKESYAGLAKKVNMGQKYFLASAEASKSEWSQKSANRLRQLYRLLWARVEGISVQGLDHDQQAKNKQKQRLQLIMASDLYDMNHRLQAEEFPLGNINPRSKAIMDESKVWIRKLEEFALGLSLGPEMIRDKAVKNKKLSRYLEKELEEKVAVNKENIKLKNKKTKKSPVPKEKALPEKSGEDIGVDPNL